jgi:hypothetical protein
MVSERIPHRILERRLGVIAPLAFMAWYRDVVDALDPPDHDVSPPDVAWTIRPSRNTTQAHSTLLPVVLRTAATILHHARVTLATIPSTSKCWPRGDNDGVKAPPVDRPPEKQRFQKYCWVLHLRAT